MTARVLALCAAFWLLAACSGGDRAYQPVSPLPEPPQHAISPLPAPSDPRTLILASPRAFAPVARTAGVVFESQCGENAVAGQMLHILATADWQQRPALRCHPLLVLAAQRKADEMLRLRYFGHVSPAGVWPNQNVRSTGYYLPDWYPVLDNSVESIGLNFATPEAMLLAWALSPSHGPHVAGTLPGFREQDCAGAGFVAGAGDSGVYYVLITARCAGMP